MGTEWLLAATAAILVMAVAIRTYRSGRSGEASGSPANAVASSQAAVSAAVLPAPAPRSSALDKAVSARPVRQGPFPSLQVVPDPARRVRQPVRRGMAMAGYEARSSIRRQVGWVDTTPPDFRVGPAQGAESASHPRVSEERGSGMAAFWDGIVDSYPEYYKAHPEARPSNQRNR